MKSLLSRLDRVRPFAIFMPMVPAASASAEAQASIEEYFESARDRLGNYLRQTLDWMNSAAGRRADLPLMQRRFTMARLRFNALLAQFDIFSEVLTQRSEHGVGVWLAGLDAFAEDALRLDGHIHRSTPLVCYLDRGFGAAIRRVNTRLPGGGPCPASLVRVPRERMVSTNIGSSVAHEIGHQGAALLGLVESAKADLDRWEGRTRTPSGLSLFRPWLSEILADMWSVGRIGIGSTLGLVSVLSLPRAMVFHWTKGAVHPFPWIRVKISCAIGRALYPNEMWDHTEQLWEALYPRKGLSAEMTRGLAVLQSALPVVADILCAHRPPALRGAALGDVLAEPKNEPMRLRRSFDRWQGDVHALRRARPTLSMAVLGQAKADGRLEAEAESKIVGELLRQWALRTALGRTARCALNSERPQMFRVA